MTLALDQVRKHYPLRAGLFRPKRYVRAVDGVSLSIAQGRTLALVGESGGGKSTIAKLVLGLERPTGGTVRVAGLDPWAAGGPSLAYRRAVQIVFQDPRSSLDPHMRVGDFVGEPMLVQTKLSRAERSERVSELLRAVGLPHEAARLFPHQFSSGQRQRVAIARAISVEPQLIVLDEPVSSLDVSLRAQILNLLRDIGDSRRIAYLLITHDFGVVHYMASTTAVIYRGKIVEIGPTSEVMRSPLHPYTTSLIEATVRDRSARLAQAATSDAATQAAAPRGCSFRDRCSFAMPRCAEKEPALVDVGPGHAAACFLHASAAAGAS